jgi:hypothetical protein
MVVYSAQRNMKTYLDTYFNDAAQITGDGGGAVNVIVAFDNPNYPISRVFIDKGVKLIASVGQSESQSIVDSDHYPVGYDEKVPVTLAAMDQAGVTAILMLEKGEAELRRVAETYPFGSLRRITGSKPETEWHGGFYIFKVQYVFSYKRNLT